MLNLLCFVHSKIFFHRIPIDQRYRSCFAVETWFNNFHWKQKSLPYPFVRFCKTPLGNVSSLCPAVPCPAIPTSANYTASYNTTLHESRITVTCTEGYRTPDGRTEMVIICTSLSEWFPQPPFCIGKCVYHEWSWGYRPKTEFQMLCTITKCVWLSEANYIFTFM